ncbi:glycosyltransferase family 9 protein [Polaromonas sp. YR568]|uniref:glycosyltransferase family 9 protein n=1 Tax=Polaromonas sp. YR568 TaxID=1855301 RepID=UPI0011136DC1|nr:glycosyltransferase family 9 protein [Polaromonas sp. YR568]
MVLASRQAMLEEALILCGAIEQRRAGSAALLACGELLRDIPAVATASRAFRIVVDEAVPAVHSKPPVWRRLMRAGPLRVLWTPFEMARRRGQARAVLTREQPKVIVVFEDRIPDPEMVWLEEAARLDIPAMLVRYASSSSESDAWTRRDKTAYSLDRGALAWARRLFARAYPAHALDLGMGPQIFYSLWDSLALAVSGMAGTQPWVVGGGRVAVAAIQGPTDFEEAVKLTQTPERFRITGQPSWDLMARAEKRQTSSPLVAHGAPGPQPPRLVCALPQWGEHLQMPWPQHIEKIAQLCAILGNTGCEVVLSLHPKTQRDRYQPIADLHQLHISDLPLSAILPGADLFVASWSSTLRWAAMLGIASVNLDWAGQGYTLFSELGSLPVSNQPVDLAPLLANLADDPGHRTRLGAQLREESFPYGAIDGQSGQRILSLIENLAGGGHG